MPSPPYSERLSAFLEWFTDLTVSEKWVPVVSGGLGALGAVSAQVVSAIFTGKREKRTAAQAQNMAQAALFREDKMDLFVQALERIDTYRDGCKKHWSEVVRTGGAIDLPVPIGTDFTTDGRISHQLDLLAPELTDATNTCIRHLTSYSTVAVTRDENQYKRWLQTAAKLRGKVRDEMRESLGANPVARGGAKKSKKKWRRTKG